MISRKRTKKKEEKLYRVHYKIEAEYITEVRAQNFEEALKLSGKEFDQAYFGQAVNVHGEAFYAEESRKKGDRKSNMMANALTT